MKIERFEDIKAWKEARELAKIVYENFKDIKDYGFKDQIQRAAVSIMSNIAEGFDRHSNKDFIHFLVIARGSVSEVKSLLYVALDNEYIDSKMFEKLYNHCNKIANLINGFIRYLRNSSRSC
ncbi:four helix bundle protein [Deferribacter autotrophicus]|uniref:Four helix bundle protein n=1 Tax=Deferribacter autotrophicus TaxID=500465 RepID=A0A5A8F0R1_9BACT|nr:four helix bundle protein [Deferribacter autotrophicus]KAA0257658.1 four helix bundle protein [Deferribacter autotrophicus]